ncbi:MAG: hypothetical protein ACREUT_17000 [Steroidobacteraceae bacterium]
MHHRRLQHRSFEWLCACILLTPCGVLAQQPGRTPPQPAPSAQQAAASSAGPNAASAKQADDLEPAVDTSADAARARTERDAKHGQRGRAPGKPIDHLELGTTDITGNRELPKVMYIVPWKRSDLGDLTGKPLNSLVDQTLEPVDRNVFERANQYYGAVTAGAAHGGAASAGASSAVRPQDVHRTPDAGSGSAVRDER